MPKNKFSVKAYRIQNLKKAIELSIQLNAKKRERIYGVGIEKLKDEEGGWFVGGRDPKRKRNKWYGDNTIFYKGILIRKGKVRYSDKSKGYFYIEKPEGYEGNPDIEGKDAYWKDGYLFYEEETSRGEGRRFAPQFIIKDGVVREVRGVLKGTQRGKYKTSAIRNREKERERERDREEENKSFRVEFSRLKKNTPINFETEKANRYIKNPTGWGKFKGDKIYSNVFKKNEDMTGGGYFGREQTGIRKYPYTFSFNPNNSAGIDEDLTRRNHFFIKNSRGEEIPSKNTPYLDLSRVIIEKPSVFIKKIYRSQDNGDNREKYAGQYKLSYATGVRSGDKGLYREVKELYDGQYTMEYKIRQGTTKKDIEDYVRKFFSPSEKQLKDYKKASGRAIEEEIKEIQRKKVEARKPKPVVVEKKKRPRLEKQEGLQGLSRKELNSIASKLKKEKKIKTEGKMKDKNKEWLVDFIKKNR